MGALHDLYAVQLSDIAISQAQHRLAHLPESAAYQLAKSASANAITELAALDKRSAEAGSEITGLEKQAHEIDSTLARLNKQMKTIIAPREAEALQHEIATCTNNRSALDDRELELLEIVERVVMTRERGHALCFAKLVSKECEIARLGNRRIFLTQTPSASITRVGWHCIWLLALRNALLVLALFVGFELLKRVDRHIHLAAHFEHLRNG